METASMHPHQPIEYVLKDGARFEASRISLLEDKHANIYEIRVSGVILAPGDGPVARILLFKLSQPVDLAENLTAIAGRLLLAGDYEVV